jgi:hypothetical protein
MNLGASTSLRLAGFGAWRELQVSSQPCGDFQQPGACYMEILEIMRVMELRTETKERIRLRTPARGHLDTAMKHRLPQYCTIRRLSHSSTQRHVAACVVANKYTPALIMPMKFSQHRQGIIIAIQAHFLSQTIPQLLKHITRGNCREVAAARYEGGDSVRDPARNALRRQAGAKQPLDVVHLDVARILQGTSLTVLDLGVAEGTGHGVRGAHTVPLDERGRHVASRGHADERHEVL